MIPAAITKIKKDLEWRTPTSNKPMSHVALPRAQAIELVKTFEKFDRLHPQARSKRRKSHGA
jgi:hypothetical protein